MTALYRWTYYLVSYWWTTATVWLVGSTQRCTDGQYQRFDWLVLCKNILIDNSNALTDWFYAKIFWWTIATLWLVVCKNILIDNSNALTDWFYAKMCHFRSATAKLLLVGSVQGYKLSFHIFQMGNGNAFIGLFCTGMDRFRSFTWATATLIFALNRDISFYSFWIGNSNAFLICSMQGCII